jgi:molybdopterin synthase catalytic subunit
MVVVAAGHRGRLRGGGFPDGFLKTRAPFWKKEHRLDGAAGDWVAAKEADDRAAERWG